MKLLVINGPNINMLGVRENDIYGDKAYEDLVDYIQVQCAKKNTDVEVYQSNSEGDIITKIQQAYGRFDGIIINPAAYTHTSIGILDALKAISIPTVEVHLSNIYERDEFRQLSYVSMVANKTIFGKGFEGYAEAIDYLYKMIRPTKGHNSGCG